MKSLVWMTVFLPLLAILSGCEKRREVKGNTTFSTRENQYVAVIVMDLSGSFSQLMAEDGKAYRFAAHVVDEYFRNRDALDDKLILAQISGTQRSLLWEGTPQQLRKNFPTAEAFRDFVLRKADNRGSLVHEGLANVVDYVAADPQFAKGRSAATLLVLSDMQDTDNNPDSRRRLMESLSEFGKLDGAVGIYFCDQLEIANWKQRLADCGIQNSVVESEIVGQPQLPSFE